MKQSKVVAGLVASAMLSMAPGAFGALIEGFESGTTGLWGAGDAGGLSPTTAVNSTRGTEGTLSFESSFTVGNGSYGWSPRGILGAYAPSVLTAGATTLSMDIYQDWANPEGWGLWANTFNLIFNNNSALANGGWKIVSPATVTDLSSGWKTFSFDVTGYVAAALDPLNGWSGLDIVWFVGGGPDGFVGANGVQTISVDNINLQATAVPEPSGIVLASLGAASLLMFRRRRV